MTVKQWIAELSLYDDDMEVCFELDEDIECESWTENMYGGKSVHVCENLKETHICQVNQYVSVELGVDEE